MRRILIVEDANASRNALARLMQQEGYVTSVAGNGAEALVKLRADKPDLILLDHTMPQAVRRHNAPPTHSTFPSSPQPSRHPPSLFSSLLSVVLSVGVGCRLLCGVV